MLQIQLSPGLPSGSWALLRPLCGHDEASVTDTGAIAAATLLDRLLVETSGTTVGPGKAWELAVCDRDRLLATIYLQYFGCQIESTVACTNCDKPFDLTFSLSDMMGRLQATRLTTCSGPDEACVYMLSDERRFRLPTVADLHDVVNLAADAATRTLLERCMVEGDPAVDPDVVQAAMEEAGPVLNIGLDASCPECGRGRRVRFDIGSYLLSVLSHERRFLVHEVHRIASAYGWGLDAILRLSRDDRRAYVRLIEGDHRARRRVLQ